MKPIVALSTCWSSHRHQDGYAMLREIADLGFEWVELSHGVRIALVPGILKAVEEGVVKIASCHNFCPLPPGVTRAAPNLYQPSAGDDREREQWLRQSRRTLDFARQVGAKKVVLHLGSVAFFWGDPGDKLEAYRARHRTADLTKDERYQKLLKRAVQKMRDRRPPFWEYTQQSVAALVPHAIERGVALGFENREGFAELPMDGDHFDLVVALAQPTTACGYWHDTGHAQIKHDLGLLNHAEHLARNAPHLIGFHLHDVSEGRDHQAIGSGAIDFEMISRVWRPEHTLVIELSPRLTPQEVTASKQRVDALVAARFPTARPGLGA